MAKTEKTADVIENIEFSAFDASKATDQFRTFAEKGVEQSKEAYAKVKA
ncbi:phasin, partial [Rhizobiaceae sp. 2RAB30]